MQEQESTKSQSHEPQIVICTDGLGMEARQFFDAVTRRAYEIFEAKGRPMGTELENWFQAEQELFERAPFRLSESAESVSVLADVHSYMPKEVEVDLEPRRITIIGRHDGSTPRKHDGAASTKKSTLMVSLQLPVEVDPQRATARVRRGILELDVKKVPAAKATHGQSAGAHAT